MPQSTADRWIGSRLNAVIEETNDAFRDHRYQEAANAVWTFFWDDFCDKYLELKKSDTDWGFAHEVHEKALLLLHPLMPFITEELWHRRGHEKSISLEPFPTPDPEWDDQEDRHQNEISFLLDRAPFNGLITGIRLRRADAKIDKKQTLKLDVIADDWFDAIQGTNSAIERLENVELDLRKGDPNEMPWWSPDVHTPHAEWIYMGPGPDGTLVTRFKAWLHVAETHEQRQRLKKENEDLEKVIANSKRQLENEDFTKKAPVKVVETIRANLAKYEAKLAENKAKLVQ